MSFPYGRKVGSVPAMRDKVENSGFRAVSSRVIVFGTSALTNDLFPFANRGEWLEDR